MGAIGRFEAENATNLTIYSLRGCVLEIDEEEQTMSHEPQTQYLGAQSQSSASEVAQLGTFGLFCRLDMSRTLLSLLG